MTKTCSVCRKQIAASASACPYCGNKYTSAFVWGALVFMLFLLALILAVVLR